MAERGKNIYLPGPKPVLINIPRFKFLTIKGNGNPNGEDFSNRVEALYSLSYAIRMMPKKGFKPEGYFEYTVYPLEGIWDLSDVGRTNLTLDKSQLVYTIMIRQPDFVTGEVFSKVAEIIDKRKPNKLSGEVRLEEIEDGNSVQMLHMGSYDNEKISFDLMKSFISVKGLRFRTMVHREIYLSDPRKSDPDKLKTVLRYMVD